MSYLTLLNLEWEPVWIGFLSKRQCLLLWFLFWKRITLPSSANIISSLSHDCCCVCTENQKSTLPVFPFLICTPFLTSDPSTLAFQRNPLFRHIFGHKAKILWLEEHEKLLWQIQVLHCRSTGSRDFEEVFANAGGDFAGMFSYLILLKLRCGIFSRFFTLPPDLKIDNWLTFKAKSMGVFCLVSLNAPSFC